MYVGFVFAAIFIGYSMGVAPVVSYNYGAQNNLELKNIFRKSITIISITSIIMLISSEITSGLLASIFTSYDERLFSLTKEAFIIYSVSFLLCGTNIFSSSFFTALNNGTISAFLSVSRTLSFQVTSILFLPSIFKSKGIWLASPSAEAACLIISIICLISLKKKYNY